MKAILALLIILIMLAAGCGCFESTTPVRSPTILPTYTTAEDDIELARKFCPVIHLKGETDITENFEPDPVQLMVDLSYLKNQVDPGFLIDPTIADLHDYPQSEGYLDIVGLDPETSTLGDYMAAYEPVKAGYHPTIYARVMNDGNHTILQYWLFYYFNDWRNFHEGDWELVQLNFPRYPSRELLERNDMPVLAAYSQHQAGQKIAWTDMQSEDMVIDQSHPAVYVAQGSHANYFKPGHYWSGLDFDDTGTSDWLIIGPDDIDVVLLQDEAELERREWLDFRGYWGKHFSLSISFLELEFFKSGPSGPQWSEGGEASSKWDEPGKWADGLAEYPNPFWVSFLIQIGDWIKNAIFSIFSPADLHVYDTAGRHVGFNEAGELEIEIPGAMYVNPEGTDYKTIIIPDADVSQEYRVVIKGNGDGVMDLKAMVPDAGNNIRRFLEYLGVPVTPNTIAELTIAAELGEYIDPQKPTDTLRDTGTLMLLDSDGDGVFERGTTPGVFGKTANDRCSLLAFRAERPLQ